MSFKLFFLSTFKGLKNTAKFENKRDALWADYQAYTNLQNSGELERYIELEKFVNSDAFKKEQAEIKALKFAGSPEAKLIAEFEKLDKDKKLKDFYLVQGSGDFQRFQELEKSDAIKKFVTLRDYVTSKQYDKDKKAFDPKNDKGEKFEDTEAHKKYEEYQRLLKSEDVIFWTEFPNSTAHKNYKEMVNSTVRARYEEIKAEMASEAFEARKAFLENANRWETTEAFEKEQEYLALKKEERFVVYEKYKASQEGLRFFQSHELLLEDHFEAGKLNEELWKPISPMAEKTLGKNFSKAGDLQAYTNGENVLQSNSNLQLTVKKEQVESVVWNFPVGFSPVTFDYSAGLLCSQESFQLSEGVLEAKIKYEPNKQLVDLFYLSDEQNTYRLNLLEAGTVCRLGVDAEGKADHESLGGLASGQFYIFSLEWGHGKISWKINGHEIHSVNHQVPGSPLRINMSSIVVDTPQKLPHLFEVDWVRLYKKK